MNGNTIQISGNLASDPELKFTPSGTAVATLNVGVSERRRNGKTGEWEDAGVTWFRTIVWGQPAEHVAESLTRGMRVMVTGTMRQRSYEDKSGDTRYVWELTAEEVGASLRFNPVEVKRTNRTKATAPDRSDPWAGIDASPDKSRLPARNEVEVTARESAERQAREADAALARGSESHGEQPGAEPTAEPTGTPERPGAAGSKPPSPAAGPAAYCSACARSGVGACDDYPNCPAGKPATETRAKRTRRAPRQASATA